MNRLKNKLVKFRRQSSIFILSLAVHIALFLILFLLPPIPMGPDIFLGSGSEIKAGLVLEDNSEGLVPDKTIETNYKQKKDIHDLFNPKEIIEEASLWTMETIEPRKEEAPDLDILGSGGRVEQSFKESIPTASYNAGFEGFQGTFNDYISLLRRVGLDVVFVLDATGSMQWIIEETKAKMTQLIKVIKRLVPIARVGIVAYRDREEEFVTKKHPLTINVKKLQYFLDSIEAKGGADPEEAVEEGLKVAIKDMKWRKNSKKIIILVGDAPPHKDDLPKALELVRRFRERGGFVSTIDTTHEANDQNFSRFNEKYIMQEFISIAQAGHGEATSLAKEKKIIKQLIVLTFGSRWKEKLHEYMRYF
jgi:hypothetical protein